MKKFLLLMLLSIFIGPLMAQTQERFNEEEEEQKPTVVEEEKPVEPAPKPLPRATPKKQSSDFWSHTRFGGNFGAGFGNGQTFINVSPRMYYAATEKLWLGTGFTFIYSSNKYYPAPYNEQFVYGVNIFSTYQLIGPLFVQAEYEPLSFETVKQNIITGEYSEERIWVHGLLLGGGITQPIGNRGAFFASILYNVTWRSYEESYYSSPYVFRIGFGI